ncbi:MAG: thiol:disulfide interchange protein DsbA/DsbL, partial [Candidatus Saccharimonadales bacterium]
MKSNDRLFRVLVSILIAFVFLPLYAHSENTDKFADGTNYVGLSPAEPTNVRQGQIEVIQFFWFGCPHCFAVEPYLEAWLKHKPSNVVFKRIPANFPGSEQWGIDARAFYVAQALGIENKIQEPL